MHTYMQACIPPHTCEPSTLRMLHFESHSPQVQISQFTRPVRSSDLRRSARRSRLSASTPWPLGLLAKHCLLQKLIHKDSSTINAHTPSYILAYKNDAKMQLNASIHTSMHTYAQPKVDAKAQFLSSKCRGSKKYAKRVGHSKK